MPDHSCLRLGNSNVELQGHTLLVPIVFGRLSCVFGRLQNFSFLVLS